MIRIETNVKEIALRIRQIPAKLQRGANRTLSDASNEIARIMSRPGAAIRYPVSWDSVKQRIAVIIKLKRERNLPYRRTGAYEGGWKSEAITGGYMVSNVGHKAVFIAGTPLAAGFGSGSKVTASGQSHIHQGRWRLIRPVVEAVLSRLPRNLLEALKIEVNRG